MNIRNKIAFSIYVIVSISSVSVGTIYLFSAKFMPYHAEIIGKNWEKLDEPLQILLLALMKGMGSGLIGVGVIILFLLLYSFRKGEKWVRFALPFIGLISYTTLFYVTLNAKLNTNASTPWHFNLLNIVLIVIAFILSLNYHNKIKGVI